MYQTFNPPPGTTLPIIQRLIAVYKLWHGYLPNFPKKSKYTLGNKIDLIFLELMGLIYIALYLPKDQKLPYIKKSIGKLDLIKFFLKISWEIGAMENKHYIAISSPLDEIGRMLGGWYKQLDR